MSYSFFLATAILLNIMPGPAMLYVAQQTLLRGIRGGILSLAGIETGTLLHIIASVLGLSVVIAKSAFLLILIQYVSATFLIYLGVNQIFKTPKISIVAETKNNHYSTFFKATVINTFNPKVIIFFLALLPQIINQNMSSDMQIIIFGSIFGLCGAIINFLVIYFLNKIVANFILEQSRYTKIIQHTVRVMSVILILFGLSIFLSKIFRS